MSRPNLARATELKISIRRLVVDAELASGHPGAEQIAEHLRHALGQAAASDDAVRSPGPDLGRAVWQQVKARLGAV